MRKILFCLWLASCGSLPTLFAAQYCIRADAPAGGDGTSWDKAWRDLPDVLTRGDTYFVADGDYGSWKLDDNASGSTYIHIKKATEADHGIGAGWQASYGDGLAVLKPIWFSRPPSGYGGYYDINGYSPAVSRNCGIKITNGSVNDTLIEYGISDTGHHPRCNYRYLELAGPYGSGDYRAGPQPWSYGVYLHGNNGAYDTSHTLFSHCYIHGVTTHFQDNNGNNYMTVEYCELSDSRNIDGIDHGNIYWVGSSYGTFRYNRVYNYNAEGLYFGASTNGWAIYGNMFYDTVGTGRGIEFRTPQTDTLIYNNSFVKLTLSNNYVAVRVMADAGACSGVQVRNNVLVGCGISLENGGVGVTTSNNISADTNAFVNYNAKDFHLAAAMGPGVSLPAPYNTDPEGKIRGADGTWDVGAYEYGGTVSLPHPADTNTDYLIGLNEATTFGACWKTNCNANATLDNASRAGYLWKGSATGAYQYNSANACPLCWEVKP